MAKRKKKKRSIWWALITILFLITAGLLYIMNRYQPSSIRYTAFGIDLPSGYSIHGIDISKYQQLIDWPAVKAMKVKDKKIGFVFIKATEGQGMVDARFRQNWFRAEQAGITKGAYHFFRPSVSGKAQAENFIETVKLKSGDLPPVLDVELINDAPVEQFRQRLKDWLVTVEQAVGVQPIIYSNADFYTRYLSGNFEEYPFWVAHYFAKGRPRVQRNWLFWQHSERGKVDGIKPSVDFNVFNGDSTDFVDLLIP
jgi:lysozyme